MLYVKGIRMMFREGKTATRVGLLAWMTVLLVATLLGCSGPKGGGGLSPQVEFLWRQHPNPHTPEAAARAAAEAKTLLEEHPDDLQLHYYYQDRLREFDNDSLLSEYSRYLDDHPNSGVAIILEARAQKSGPYLVKRIDRALIKDSTTVEILHLGVLGNLGKQPADTAAALHYAEKAARLYPNHHLAHEALAIAYNAVGRYEDALKEARRARDLHPWRYESVGLENQALRKLGRDDEALKNTEDFFAARPTHLPTFRRLRRVYQMEREWEKLFDIEMTIAKGYPDNGFSWTYAADAALRMADMDKVMEAYEAAADWGWFDLEYSLHPMNDVQRAEFKAHPRYPQLVEKMEANRAAQRDQRREMATNNPIDVKLNGITATDLDGREVALADYLGSIVVLHFFNSAEGNNALVAERLAVFKQQHPDVKVIHVNAHPRTEGASRVKLVTKDVTRDGIDEPVWLIDDKTTQKLRVSSLPTFAVVDANGVARFRIQGYHPYIEEILGYMVEEARTPVEQIRGVMAE